MRPGAIAVVAVAIALFAGGLFFGLGGFASDDGTAVSVPRATLPPNTVAPPAPAVVETEPPASAQTIPQTTVTFPEGTETLPVPNVIGVGQATAEARLTDFDVVVTVVDATDANFLDAVSAQDPGAAARLPAGGTVSITVSVQPSPETIPADPISGGVTGVDYTALDEGDCGNGAVSDGLLVYAVVDCAEFHDVQLMKRFDVENGPDEYDELALNDLVRDQCLQPFADFVGIETGDSSLLLRAIRPNDIRYETEGERLSLCVVIAGGTVQVQGSAEGSLW